MLIPNRENTFTTGSQFAKNNLNTDMPLGKAREANTLAEALKGNIPNFLRDLVSITIEENNNKITYLVMPDVLSIGTDDDFIRMPMNPLTAQKIANQYNCSLPTKKMCDQIWKAATIKLSPHPKGAPYDNSMLSTETFVWHNNIIENQLKSFKNFDRQQLITGIKKDVVLDKDLLNKPDRVAIYGWFQTNGTPIQGPTVNSSSHEITYKDYSHGIRFIAREVFVNDKVMDLYDVLNDNNLSSLISHQGSYDVHKIYK